MKWIEVIKISIAENRRTDFETHVRSILSRLNKEEKGVRMKLYRNVLDGDLSIHLCWNNGKVEPWGSKTGLCLVHLLKEFSFVSHFVLAEEEAERAH